MTNLRFWICCWSDIRRNSWWIIVTVIYNLFKTELLHPKSIDVISSINMKQFVKSKSICHIITNQYDQLFWNQNTQLIKSWQTHISIRQKKTFILGLGRISKYPVRKSRISGKACRRIRPYIRQENSDPAQP